MKLEQRSLRVGAAAIICAIVFRLLSGGLPERIVAALATPEVAAFLLYLETGKVVRPAEPQVPTQPETEPTEALPTEPEIFQAVFGPEDALLVEVNSVCDYSVDISQLLLQPLSWNLTAATPTVLILHSHGTESYLKTEDYTESSAYRTLDNAYNMVSIGQCVAQLLEDAGIGVIHDTTLHDYPSYTDSYNNSRDAVKAYLSQYPGICLVLDLHRDAIEDSGGNQLGYTVDTPQGKAAQLMLVVGTDANGLTHPDWENNMALGVKLYAQLEKNAPGICRPISFRPQRFNQDLSSGALLIEVGAAGNTRQEALLSAKLLAQAISDLAYGTK